MEQKFVTLAFVEHEVGNKECSECFNLLMQKQCSCGGLIHNEFIDEDMNRPHGEECKFEYLCDNCGSTTPPEPLPELGKD